MSIQQELHEAHKARLARMNPAPASLHNLWYSRAHEMLALLDCDLGESNPCPTVRSIQDAVCENYGISRKDMLSCRRSRHLADARHVAFYLARELTARSYSEVGRMFNRDHSTVTYGCKKVECNLAEHQADIDAIMGMIP